MLTVKPVTFEGSECRLMFSDGAMLAVKNATLAPYGIWIAQPAGAGVHLECAGHAAPLPWPPAQPKLHDGRQDHREDSQDHRVNRRRLKSDDRCVYGKDMDVVPAPGAAQSKNAVMADPDACCAACAANPDCVVANYDIADKTCWEKVKPYTVKPNAMDKQGVWILYLCRRDGSDDPSLLALNKAGGACHRRT